MTTPTANAPMGRAEFIALMAMMIATVAFSIDAMLPALPDIGRDLTPEDPTRAALVISSFVLGMGVGTFFAGPLSDAFGRRQVMVWSAVLYIGSAALAWASSTLEIMLIARVLQGIGASGPRVVSIAIIRDLFAGREMARIMSIAMMIFTLVPAIAPALGMLIISFAGWRGIFAAFITFSVIALVWFLMRQPETLDPDSRRPMRPRLMAAAVREMFTEPVVRVAILVQTLSMAMLFSLLMLIQPIYALVFDRLESFPFWFGAVAAISAGASFLNALLVVRFGMRRLVTLALGVQIVLSGGLLATSGYVTESGFAVFVFWQAYVFFQAGLTMGNLNAIAMEPMGHIAGMAASVVGGFATVFAACIASPIGLMFNGTIIPLVASVLVMAVVGFGLMLYMRSLERRARTA